MAIPPWKLRLQPATFKGIGFHVDADIRSGGRRIALHEFPKRDFPYAEDMGRRARRFVIAGYLIGPDYQAQRDALVTALEDDGPGVLVHPTYQDQGPVVADTYTVTERRERGGWAEFEAVFIEAGRAVDQQFDTDMQGTVNRKVDTAVGPTVQSTADTFINPPTILSSTNLSAFDVANTFMNSSDITALQ
jgi:prophage DNA circulation protein